MSDINLEHTVENPNQEFTTRYRKDGSIEQGNKPIVLQRNPNFSVDQAITGMINYAKKSGRQVQQTINNVVMHAGPQSSFKNMKDAYEQARKNGQSQASPSPSPSNQPAAQSAEAQQAQGTDSGSFSNKEEGQSDKDNSTQQNPPWYEQMIQEVEGRVMERVGEVANMDTMKQAITEAVEDVYKHVDANHRTSITIENRTQEPPTVTNIEGCHKMLPDVIGIIQAGCWCAAVGPTGSGKTLGVKQYAKMMQIPIMCIKQMTRIIAPHDLIGFIDAGGHYRKGAWTDAILGYVFDNALNIGAPLTETEGNHKDAIIIVDEMDNSNENVVMIIKALKTGSIMMPYGMQEVNPKLVVVATMNTWGTGATREYVGRMAQDAALLNEFNMIEWDYDTSFERELLYAHYNAFTDKGEYTTKHIDMLHGMFLGMRRKAAEQKVRVIISTRGIMDSLKLLLTNKKWTINKVLHMTVYKGLKEEDIKRVECPELWTIIPSSKETPTPAKAVKGVSPFGPSVATTNDECPI